MSNLIAFTYVFVTPKTFATVCSFLLCVMAGGTQTQHFFWYVQPKSLNFGTFELINCHKSGVLWVDFYQQTGA